MKDSEFIELLNLYLDHEITAADAARLEAEVQSNANRRRVYQDYCRMQKACKVLAQDFADETADETERKVVAFDQTARTNRRNISRYITGTLAAAAACATVLFVARTHEQTGAAVSNTTVVATTPAPVPAPAAVAVSTEVAPAPHRGIEHQNLNTLALRSPENNSLLTANVQSDPHFAWLEGVRLAPLQAPAPVDQVRFSVETPTQPGDRTYSSKKPLPSDVEWVAFSFQR